MLRRILTGFHTAETLQPFIADSTASCCVWCAHPTVMYCPSIGTWCLAYLRKNSGELALVEALILALEDSFVVVAVPVEAADADADSSSFHAGSVRCAALRILVSGLRLLDGGMVAYSFLGVKPQFVTVMQSWTALKGTLREPRDMETVPTDDTRISRLERMFTDLMSPSGSGPSEELPREVRGKSTDDTDERISRLERISSGFVRAPHAPSATVAPGGPSATESSESSESAAAHPCWLVE